MISVISGWGLEGAGLYTDEIPSWGRGRGHSLGGNRNVCGMLAFCRVLLCFTSLSLPVSSQLLKSVFPRLSLARNLNLGEGVELDAKPRLVGLGSEALVSCPVRPGRGNRSRSAQALPEPVLFVSVPFFSPLHRSLGATQMAPLQFPEQSSIGRKLLRQPLPVSFLQRGGRGCG